MNKHEMGTFLGLIFAVVLGVVLAKMPLANTSLIKAVSSLETRVQLIENKLNSTNNPSTNVSNKKP